MDKQERYHERIVVAVAKHEQAVAAPNAKLSAAIEKAESEEERRKLFEAFDLEIADARDRYHREIGDAATERDS